MKKVYLLELVPSAGPANIIAICGSMDRAKVTAWTHAPGLVGPQWHTDGKRTWTQRQPGGDRLMVTEFDLHE